MFRLAAMPMGVLGDPMTPIVPLFVSYLNRNRCFLYKGIVHALLHWPIAFCCHGVLFP